MEDMENVLYEIDILRKELLNIVENNESLFDPEVLKKSMLLDLVLIEYYNLHGRTNDEKI